jgi:hypothetical protein
VTECYDDNVVDPPKFITAKNVMNFFEKLGLDPEGGRQIFTALCAVLRRKKRKVAIGGIQEEDEEGEYEEEVDSRHSSVADFDHSNEKNKSTTNTPIPGRTRQTAIDIPVSSPSSAKSIVSLSNNNPHSPTLPSTASPTPVTTNESNSNTNNSVDRMDVNDFLRYDNYTTTLLNLTSCILVVILLLVHLLFVYNIQTGR